MIEARLQTAKEDGEELTYEDIVQELGISDEEMSGLSGGNLDYYKELFDFYCIVVPGITY